MGIPGSPKKPFSSAQVAQHDKSIAMSRDAVAASVADVGACVVRVPCEAGLTGRGRQELEASWSHWTPPPSRKFGRQDPGRQSHRWTKEVLKQRMQALGPCGVALSFTQTVSKAMVSGVMSALTCTFTHECQLQWKALIRSEPP